MLNILIDENRHRKNIIQVQRDLSCTRAGILAERPPPFSPLHWRIIAEIESHIDRGIQSICRKGGLGRLSCYIRYQRPVRKDPLATNITPCDCLAGKATSLFNILLSQLGRKGCLASTPTSCHSLVGEDTHINIPKIAPYRRKGTLEILLFVVTTGRKSLPNAQVI